MNWDNALTTLWNKISKPITNALIGMAFLFYAPDGTNWLGWVFLAIGVGGFLDNQSKHLPRLWRLIQRKQRIKDEIEKLPKSERMILAIMVKCNKRIMREDDFKKELSVFKSDYSRKLPSDIYDHFTSLDDKELIHFSVGDFGPFSVTVQQDVWKIVKWRYKKEFSTAEKEKA